MCLLAHVTVCGRCKSSVPFTRPAPVTPSRPRRLQGAMYLVFALTATLCLVVAAGAAASWPAMVKPALVILLLLTLLGWAAAAALTLLLRGGSDACVALEPLLLSLADGKPLLVYLLSGSGGSLLTVLSSTLGADSGLDVAAAAVTAGEALSGVEAALAPWPALQAEAAPAMEAAAAHLGALILRLSELEAAAGYPAFHAVSWWEH